MVALTPDSETRSKNRPRNSVLPHAIRIALPDQGQSLQIANLGQRRTAEHAFVGANGPVEDFGEEYQLDCPFCGDRRGRMRINHTYDPALNVGRWYCFNDQCHKKPECRQQLASRLQSCWARAKTQARSQGVQPTRVAAISTTTTQPNVDPALPAGSIPINHLPADHSAIQYLLSRNYNIQKLWDDFKIGYAAASSFPAPAFQHRLVIPIYEPTIDQADGPKLIGWQAREISAVDAPPSESPKYLTMAGFKKSHVLYSTVTGTHGPEMVIVEGVSDVWRVGNTAVALLGKVASPRQLELLVQIGQFKRFVYIALDRDATDEAETLVQELSHRFASLGVTTQVIPISYINGRKDPGECSDQEFALSRRQSYSNYGGPTVLHTQPVAQAMIEPPSELIEPDLIAARLIEHATGAKPTTTTDYDAELRRLGMHELYHQLELPLIPVLQQIESHGLLVNNRNLCHIVQSRSSALAAEAVRLRKSICLSTHRVHTHLDALGTLTGRITTKDYPLQNLSRGLRPSIVAGPGCKLIHADYGQFEWRIAAALSNDPLLLDVFRWADFDLYGSIAATISGRPASEVEPEFRTLVKQQLMRFLYHEDRLNASSPVGQAVSQFVAATHPTLLNWLLTQQDTGTRDGFVRTPFGRLVHLSSDEHSSRRSREAVNYLIQATAADVFKYACLAVSRALPDRARILLPHHDALLIECPADSATEIGDVVRTAMEHPLPNLPVRLEVKLSISDSWE